MRDLQDRIRLAVMNRNGKWRVEEVADFDVLLASGCDYTLAFYKGHRHGFAIFYDEHCYCEDAYQAVMQYCREEGIEI